MGACHAAGPGSIPGWDKFPGWGFFEGVSSPVRRMSGSFRPTSSSSLARQPVMGPGLPQKLLPFASIHSKPYPISFPNCSNILRDAVLPSSFRSSFGSLPIRYSCKHLSHYSFFIHSLKCPAHFNLFILIYFTISGSLYMLYNSELFLLLHWSFSIIPPRMHLKMFCFHICLVHFHLLFVNAHISDAYVMTGLINTL